MAITINPQTRVIFIPQADLTLVQGSNYQLDVDSFRRQLKDIEDDPFAGIYLVDTHNHTPPVTLSGTTYARFVEIINGYTVEFEDGQYSVALKGANNNIVDVLVQNQVSVVANNSSGLIESDLIEFSSFSGVITIDQANGTPGTEFPTGTLQQPVNNVADAVLIANARGLDVLHFVGPYTFSSSDDVSGFILTGRSPKSNLLTFASGTNTTNIGIENCAVTGEIKNVSFMKACAILTVTDVTVGDVGILLLDACDFIGSYTANSSMFGEIHAINCFSGIPGSTRPIFDYGGADLDNLFRHYVGGLEFRNVTAAGSINSVDVVAGNIVFDSSCTNGTFIVRGNSLFTDNSNGTTVDTTGLINRQLLADSIWDESTADHMVVGSAGKTLADAKREATTAKALSA